MRDVIFLVADGSMEQMLRGFLGRPEFHRSLGCGRFRFADRDLIVATRRDSEVYGSAHELLRLYQATHARAVVLLDNAWEGSPGAAAIQDRLSGRLRDSSWEQFAVIVLDPELESWVWQDNPHVAAALGCRTDFRQILAESGHWPTGQAKPTNPKDALTYLRTSHRADRSKAVFHRLAGRISVRGCGDAAFLRLRDILRDWFPEEVL